MWTLDLIFKKIYTFPLKYKCRIFDPISLICSKYRKATILLEKNKTGTVKMKEMKQRCWHQFAYISIGFPFIHSYIGEQLIGVSLNVDCYWQIIAAFIFCNLVFHTLFIECRLINWYFITNCLLINLRLFSHSQIY